MYEPQAQATTWALSGGLRKYPGFALRFRQCAAMQPPDPREDPKSRSLNGVPKTYPLVARVPNSGDLRSRASGLLREGQGPKVNLGFAVQGLGFRIGLFAQFRV